MMVRLITTKSLSIGNTVLQTNFIQYFTMIHSKNVKMIYKMLKWIIINCMYPTQRENFMSKTLEKVLIVKEVILANMKTAYRFEKSWKKLIFHFKIN